MSTLQPGVKSVRFCVRIAGNRDFPELYVATSMDRLPDINDQYHISGQVWGRVRNVCPGKVTIGHRRYDVDIQADVSFQDFGTLMSTLRWRD